MIHNLVLLYTLVSLYNHLKQSKTFSKTIFMTCKDKSRIPLKVFNNLEKFAKGYECYIFDDEECKLFFNHFFGDRYVNRFISLKQGAHKADLFRYCILYIFGGIYLDIKTELLVPLDDFFQDPTKLYTVVTPSSKWIYQGVIATPPNEPLMLQLAEHVLLNDPTEYHSYVKEFYKRVTDNPPKNLLLFEERISNNSEDCSGLDRYGLCCYIYDSNGNKIIKTRFNDYPW